MSREETAVVVINPFEVPEDRRQEALAAWDRAAAYLERQDGFIEARLHRTVDPHARYAFVTVATWASAQQFAAAVGSEEFRVLEEGLADFPHGPGVYEVVRELKASLRTATESTSARRASTCSSC